MKFFRFFKPKNDLFEPFWGPLRAEGAKNFWPIFGLGPQKPRDIVVCRCVGVWVSICVYVWVMCIVCVLNMCSCACMSFLLFYLSSCMLLFINMPIIGEKRAHFNYPTTSKTKHWYGCGWTNRTIHNTVYADFVRENLGKFEFCGKIRRRHFSLLIVPYLHAKFQKISCSSFPWIASLTN